MPASRPNIQEIAARVQAVEATTDAASSWSVVEEADYRSDGTPIAWREVRAGREVVARLDFSHRVEAEFIASARQDVPALLAEIMRLERLIETSCSRCEEAVQLASRVGWGGSTDSFTTSDGDPVAWMALEIRTLRAVMRSSS